MNNIKAFDEFLLEIKSEKDIVKDLARHLAFDKDIIKYLNTSRAKREIGWREMLDTKLHGSNKDYINYLTKNMIADYNPQITGYIHINTEGEGDFDQEVADRNREFDNMSLDDKINDLNNRTTGIEYVLGVYPDDEETYDKVEKELKKVGYEKPEPPLRLNKKKSEDKEEEEKEDTPDDNEEE